MNLAHARGPHRHTRRVRLSGNSPSVVSMNAPVRFALRIRAADFATRSFRSCFKKNISNIAHTKIKNKLTDSAVLAAAFATFGACGELAVRGVASRAPTPRARLRARDERNGRRRNGRIRTVSSRLAKKKKNRRLAGASASSAEGFAPLLVRAPRVERGKPGATGFEPATFEPAFGAPTVVLFSGRSTAAEGYPGSCQRRYRRPNQRWTQTRNTA